jgi:hydrogenase maturation protease
MPESTGSIVLVIGVGNETRRDDAAGLIVSRKLKAELSEDGVVVVEETGDGARLVERWRGFNITILIDALRSGDEPGRVHRFEAHKSPLPASLFQYSTHAFGVPQAIELARAMDQLPQRLIVYGIEGKRFDQGTSLSHVVEQAAQELVESLIIEIIQYQSLIT